MKLTGKTKEAFLKWLDVDRRMELHLPDVYLNALIIEFFDSVWIYITIDPQKEFENIYFDVSIDFELYGVWSTRQQATNKAIEKANTIYNKT